LYPFLSRVLKEIRFLLISGISLIYQISDNTIMHPNMNKSNANNLI
jgi:hypothetical protein